MNIALSIAFEKYSQYFSNIFVIVFERMVKQIKIAAK